MSVKETASLELNGRTSLKNQDNLASTSEQLLQQEPIAGTPFTLVNKENNGWFISWGNYRLSETRETKEDAASYLDSNRWDVIAVYIIAVTTQMEKVRNPGIIAGLEGKNGIVNNKTSK